jgi:rhodanese-related sulfurtransferase
MFTETIEKLKRKDMLRKAKIFFENRTDFTRGPVELNKMIKEGEKINIIDVRRPEDYNKEHLPGAINLPEESWSTFKGLGKDRTNVVYCYSVVCQLATRAARYFSEHDFPVIELVGGIEQWKNHKLPIVSSEKSM